MKRIEIKIISNIVLVIGLSCTTNEINDSKKKIIYSDCNNSGKIELKHLPKNKLLKRESILLWDSLNFEPNQFIAKHVNCENTDISISEINYEFDTVINNFSMKLLIHRNVLENDAKEEVLLKDVNFFLNHLQSMSCMLKDRVKPNKVADLGKMIFYDEIAFENSNCNSITYKYIYYRFAGGGSSLKGETHYKLTMSEFRDWSHTEMSSEKHLEMGTELYSR